MLCKADNVNIFLQARSVESVCDKTEEWYSTKYHMADFSEELKKKMSNPSLKENSKKLGLPPPNTLIAKSLDVLAQNTD